MPYYQKRHGTRQAGTKYRKDTLDDAPITVLVRDAINGREWSDRMSNFTLERRLLLAEQFVVFNPGRSISSMLLDLFPELRSIPRRT